MAEIATLSDAELASRLMEEKVARLHGEMGIIERSAKGVVLDRDKALAEVTALQREKAAVIDEMARLKTDTEGIKARLAEHRKNVEASLTKQEAQARVTIDQAAERTATLVAEATAVRQARAQLTGLKQTLKAEVVAAAKRLAALALETDQALAAIPD